MRPVRLALPFCLMVVSASVSAQQAYPVPVPRVPPSPPQPPQPSASPEIIAAYRAGQEGARLAMQGRFEEAIAHFRQTVETSPAGSEIYLLNSFHLRALVMPLIRANRLDEADHELAWFLDRAPSRNGPYASALLRFIDLRLYIQAGHGNVDQVLALLDTRALFLDSPSARCPAQSYFPEVVAPLHHDPRIAAKLRALGCSDVVIAQLDDVASRPIGAEIHDPGLPPRSAMSQRRR